MLDLENTSKILEKKLIELEGDIATKFYSDWISGSLFIVQTSKYF